MFLSIVLFRCCVHHAAASRSRTQAMKHGALRFVSDVVPCVCRIRCFAASPSTQLFGRLLGQAGAIQLPAFLSTSKEAAESCGGGPYAKPDALVTGAVRPFLLQTAVTVQRRPSFFVFPRDLVWCPASKEIVYTSRGFSHLVQILGDERGW